MYRWTALTSRSLPESPGNGTPSSSGGTPGRGPSPSPPRRSWSAGACSARPMTVTPAPTWSPELALGAIQLRPDLLLVRAPDGSGRLLDLAGSFYAVDPIAAELPVDRKSVV